MTTLASRLNAVANQLLDLPNGQNLTVRNLVDLASLLAEASRSLTPDEVVPDINQDE